MNRRGLNGTSGGGAKRKRTKTKGPTKAQQAARAKIIAESGITPSEEGMAAIMEELRHS